MYLVTERHQYTIQTYLDSWAPSLRQLVAVTPYESLNETEGLPPATYIFSDLDRLSTSARQSAKRMHAHLRETYGPSAVLNDPTRSLARYELLRTLWECGINDFRAYRLTETRTPQRFPVFIRQEVAHNGSLTPLLHDQAELDRAIVRQYARHLSLAGLLMVEFCDTSDDHGVFHKYSALLVGDRLVPKHAFFSHGWDIEQADLVDEDHLEEEARFLAKAPHEDDLRHIFDIAGINYGRIDYGVVDGQVRVWEINTNPLILAPRVNVKPARMAFKEKTSRDVADALEELDGRGPAHSGSAPVAVAPGHRPSVTRPRKSRSRKALRRAREAAARQVEVVAGLCWRPVMAVLKKTQWR